MYNKNEKNEKYDSFDKDTKKLEQNQKELEDQLFWREKRKLRNKAIVNNLVAFIKFMFFSVVGAGIGAALGTLVFPGIGTLIGATAGGSCGVFAGFHASYKDKVGSGFLHDFLMIFITATVGASWGAAMGTVLMPGLGTIIGAIIGGVGVSIFVATVLLIGHLYNTSEPALPKSDKGPVMPLNNSDSYNKGGPFQGLLKDLDNEHSSSSDDAIEDSASTETLNFRVSGKVGNSTKENFQKEMSFQSS